MKKILALVLAAVMVCGMGVTAFAAGTKSGDLETVTDVLLGTLTDSQGLDLVGGETIKFKIDNQEDAFTVYDKDTDNDEAVLPDILRRNVPSSAQLSAVKVTIASGATADKGYFGAGKVSYSDGWLYLEIPVKDYAGEPKALSITVTLKSGANATTPLTVSGVLTAGTGGGTDPTDPTKPAPSSSTPSNGATSVSTSTSTYSITFSKPITTVGTVDISGNATLTNPTWNAAGTVVTYTLSGLVAGTTYTVDISGFADADGNVMAAATRTFSTAGSSNDRIANAGKATTFQGGMSLAYGVQNSTTWMTSGRFVQIDCGDVHPADKEKIKIFLFTSMFNWNDDGIAAGNPTHDYYMSSQTIRNSKISARTQVAAGSKAIKSTEIKYDGGRAYIEVKFVEEWVSVDELDFEFTVYVLTDGKRRDTDGEGVTFYGTLKNYVIYVYSNDDYVDTSLGEVAHAQDFVSNIEVDLGSGVSIFTKFFKDKKYYGTATRDADDAADVVFAKYPDVDNVVILKTVGLNSTGDIVKLDTDYSDYYVYDKDLNYLGQSNTRLPFSSRYYLANRKLDVDSDYEAEDPGEEPEWTENAETGGDNGVSNANANPGTGC